MKMQGWPSASAVLGFMATTAITTLAVSTDAWSQQKQPVSFSVPPAATRYTQEHVIDVGDVPGHQVRVFELHWDDSMTGLAFAGVKAKETWIRGMSDYTNGNGTANNYNVHVMEDGNKVFAKVSVLSQASTNAEGAKVLRFASVETILGGTGKFSKLRGTLRGASERVVGSSAAAAEINGEVWFEE